jgi:hypothetical protein
LSPSLVTITNNTGHFWDDLWFVSDGELILLQPNVLLTVLTDSAGPHAAMLENHGEGVDHGALKGGQTSDLGQLKTSPALSRIPAPGERAADMAGISLPNQE